MKTEVIGDRVKHLILTIPFHLPVAVPNTLLLKGGSSDSRPFTIRPLFVPEMLSIDVGQCRMSEKKVLGCPYRWVFSTAILPGPEENKLKAEPFTMRVRHITGVIPPLSAEVLMFEMISGKLVAIAGYSLAPHWPIRYKTGGEQDYREDCQETGPQASVYSRRLANMRLPTMVVETQIARFDSISLDCGVLLTPVEIAYETYGKLNSMGSNAILIGHAFTGDAHAAGVSHEGKPGWWDNMIGPGKAFDTDRYFVICSNVLGGCQGTTGPGSINPGTGRPYAMSFPVITIRDMVRLQKMLVDSLGIKRLLCAAGGSMGGMQALEWATSYPEMVRSAIPIATTWRHSAQQIAFNEVGRQAIMADPDWAEGDYYDKKPPARGLSVARMVGHITYMSDDSMREKFGRRLREKEKLGFDFGVDFEVESYLRYRGSQFVTRFDANSYLYITKAEDYFDLTNGTGRLIDAFGSLETRFLVISFTSDWLYPSYQSQEIARVLRRINGDVAYCDLQSNYGHDAFLVDIAEQTDLVRGFLDSTARVAEAP